MNYYEILKVPKTASKQQIKSAYKKLVKQYHPDLYVGDKAFAEQKIKEINAAYAILSNSERKLAYDESLCPPEPIVSSTYSNPETSDSFKNPEPAWSLSNFIADKVNRLDPKMQLRIFIAIFVLFFTLFLLNLLQVKTILSPTTPVETPPTTQSKPPENDFLENTLQDDDFYDNSDLKAMDDFFYELFNSYEF